MIVRRDLRALLILAVPILAGCGPEPAMPLRLGINSWPGYEVMYLAQEKGLFAAEGVNVRLVEYSSLGDTRRAFERGSVDGMLCTTVELLQARERSTRRPVAILMTDFSNGSDVILAREAVSSVADLRGKRVGVEVAALGPFLLSRALERAGLELADVSLVPMDQTDMPRAITEGRVDAVVAYPPASTETLRGGAIRTLFTSAEIPAEVVDVVVLDAAILERRALDAEAIVR
ncbi:MAG: ABC transporter substrate-binding protein, partial [Planctomycetes bacterium]|nr:ABC transporter substrate-binding protein [Planctomycetota bacterium]